MKGLARRSFAGPACAPRGMSIAATAVTRIFLCIIVSIYHIAQAAASYCQCDSCNIKGGVRRRTPPGIVRQFLSYLRSRSFNARPAEKAGNLDAGICIASPVCGLRPSRFLRLRIWKVPKPVI